MEENNEIQPDQGPFSMPVNDIFIISGIGYSMVGGIKSGTVRLGDEVMLSNGLRSFVTGIQMSDDNGSYIVDWATKDEGVGLILGSISTKIPIEIKNLTVEGIDTERNHCEISVTEQFPVKGNGINVKGKILSGTVNVGDPIIYAEPDDGIFQTATVDVIEVDGSTVKSASQGQIVTLNFKGLTMRAKFDKVIKR